jgi:uncharacterized protein YoxC
LHKSFNFYLKKNVMPDNNGDKTIKEYIDDLKNGSDTAERTFKLRKAFWNRASAAYGKAQMIESSLKDYSDRIATADAAATAIDSALLRAADAGDKVTDNTDKARQAVELLTSEIQDIACQAEVLTQCLKKFRTDMESKMGKDKPGLACVDEVLKTIPDVTTHAYAGLDKVLAVAKNVHCVQTSIAANCGVNARLLGLAHLIKTCGFKETVGSEETRLSAKYTCTIPGAAKEDDAACQTVYGDYAAKNNPKCDKVFEVSFAGYRQNTNTNYDLAKAKTTAALAWLNCTAEQKNKAEAEFNACKAAYEAAVAANKC